MKSPMILIIEDSMDDFIATKRAFKKANMNNILHHCLTGEDGLDFLYRKNNYKNITESPGLLLLDLNLPGMDGHEILQIIKQDKVLCKIPTIILTTSHNNKDIEQAYSFGANSYICKPVNMDGFMKAIQQLNDYWFEIVVLPKDKHD